MSHIIKNSTLTSEARNAVAGKVIDLISATLPADANNADVLRVLAQLASSFITSNFDGDEHETVLKDFLIVTATMTKLIGVAAQQGAVQ